MEIRLDEGRLVNAEGSLAGAHVTVAQSVARLVGTLGIAPESALRMGITVPSRLMGLGLDRIEGRAMTDLILLNADLGWIGALADHLPAASHAAQ
jgi:N-acetylglucosamine-6-phosphate deacetylase